MATVVISPYGVVRFVDGGGHLWVYLQYVEALRQLGCDVYWLENYRSHGDEERDAARLSTFVKRMEAHGFGGKLILYVTRGEKGSSCDPSEYVGMNQSEAEAVFRRADLLLNFHYAIDPGMLARFRRTALVDIDPGLLQFWMSRGQLAVPLHDYCFTTGETVGAPGSPIPDCGLLWHHIQPAVCLERWPYVFDPDAEAFTTVSSWDGPDWIIDDEQAYENTKRVAFLPFAELPRLTPQTLELALFLRTAQDLEDRRLLERNGWRIRPSREVAGAPERYQSYIQSSRGEFSCVKPSCVKFQNAWISDRTLCYLASGKPVVVQDTGRSALLPNGQGMFRFATMEDAVDALATINADYERHCRAARALAEAHFDARQVVEGMLNIALTSGSMNRRLRTAGEAG